MTAALSLIIVALVGVIGALIAVVRSQQQALDAARVAADATPEPTESEADAELRRLTAALEAVDLGVLLTDATGEIVVVNGTAARLVRSHDSRALVRQAALELIERARTGTSARRELDLFGPPKATYLLRAVPLASDDAALAGSVVVVIEDISERRRTEQVRRDFVTNISHELKTPVGALGLLAETIDDETDPETLVRFARRIVAEVHRLSNTIDDLLELSRIEFGDDLQLEEGPVGPIVAEAVDRLDGAARARGIELAITGDPEMALHADHRQLTSAIANLIDNAIKYSPDHSTVTVHMERRGDECTVSVIDEGDGIPTRDLDRIFERFYRVDRARSRAAGSTGGTGLGLAIVRHIANNHGGTVSVASKEGHGSAFTLSLPAGGVGNAGFPSNGPSGETPAGTTPATDSMVNDPEVQP